jgi:serine/threonine protein kinase
LNTITVSPCPRCGTPLSSGPGIAALCPRCLTTLLPGSEPIDGRLPAASGPERIAPGHLLGKRYDIREALGRGGIGEVYRAFDVKLRVDVALKAVRAGGGRDEAARAVIRREVRAARAVVSPNVCRIKT